MAPCPPRLAYVGSQKIIGNAKVWNTTPAYNLLEPDGVCYACPMQHEPPGGYPIVARLLH